MKSKPQQVLIVQTPAGSPKFLSIDQQILHNMQKTLQIVLSRPWSILKLYLQRLNSELGHSNRQQLNQKLLNFH